MTGEIVVGRGIVGRSVDRAAVVDDALLCMVGGKVVRSGFEAKSGDFQVTISIHPWDKYAAVGLTDMHGDRLHIGFWGLDTTDQYAAAADDDRPLSKAEETEQRIKFARYWRSITESVEP